MACLSYTYLVNNEIITIISLIIGGLGLIASIAGSVLAYFTFVNPKVRVDSYLGRSKKWEQVELGLRGNNSLWRYKSHPEFTIQQQKDRKTWDSGAAERWMKYPLPDPSKTSYMMHVKAGSIVVYAEEFVTLDGGRYLVPLPRVKYHDKKEDNEYFYTPLQVSIARIIGEFYRMESIDEFVENNEVEIRKS